MTDGDMPEEGKHQGGRDLSEGGGRQEEVGE